MSATTRSVATSTSTDESTPFVEGIKWAISDAMVLAVSHLRMIPRIPEALVFSTIQPVMFVALFRYVFGGAINVGNQSYVNYLMAGIFVQTTAFGAVSTGIGLADDLQKGLVDRFRSLPMARSAVLTGRTISDLIRNMFVVFVMLLVGLLVGFRPKGNVLDWIAALALLLLLSYAFSWISSALALKIRSVEAMNSAGFIWVFPLTFASSAFVSTSTMPSWLRTFADHQPLTLFVNAVRGFTMGEPDSSAAWGATAWGIGILIVFIPLCVWLYRNTTTK